MKILLLDIECTPNLATVWGVWKQNIALNQLHETSRVMCYAAKWHKGEHIIFDSEQQSPHEAMIEGLHTLLGEADAVVHYNGNRFDIPVINREFLKYKMHPPTPFKNVDLLETVKRKFRFVSNKLDHICDELELGRKVQTGGHELWLDCMAGKEEAWERMKEYNIHDVVLLERAYDRLLPWIDNHPNHALYTDSEKMVCNNCGSHKVHKRGIAHLRTHSYQRYQCDSCGTWMRGRFTVLPKEKAKNVLVA